MSYVVASKVREFIAGKTLHCGSDVVEAANEALSVMLSAACKRATENGRKTVRACDF